MILPNVKLEHGYVCVLCGSILSRRILERDMNVLACTFTSVSHADEELPLVESLLLRKD